MARDERVGTDQITDINEVLAARNRTLYEADKQWKEASENQDAKARRQAEAQVVAETLALNAATPEGANANKIAIGGPLPSEQVDFQAMGATVKIDPKTQEQTVVSPEPEIVNGGVAADPRTPNELRDAVRAENDVKTGTVPVGKETDGGSQGQASISTVQALGGDTTGDEDVSKPTAKEGAANAKK